MPNQQLLEYVNSQLAAGQSRDAISKALATAGWPLEEIKKVIGPEISASTLAPVAPPISVKSDLGSLAFGDGSGISTFELGGVQSAQKPVAQPSSGTTMSEFAKNPLPPATTTIEEAKVAVEKPIKKKMSGGLVVVLVFVVMSLLSITGWFVFKSFSPADVVLPKTEEQRAVVSPTPVEEVDIVPPEAPDISKLQSLLETKLTERPGFALKLPAGWQESLISKEFLLEATAAVPDATVGGKYAANLAVSSVDVSDKTLKDYLDEIKTVESKTAGYELMSEAAIKVGTSSGMLQEYTHELGVFKLHSLRLTVFANTTKAFVLTLSSLNSEKDKYMTTFSEVVNNFVLR